MIHARLLVHVVFVFGYLHVGPRSVDDNSQRFGVIQRDWGLGMVFGLGLRTDVGVITCHDDLWVGMLPAENHCQCR